jgi:hypothetical protein
VKGCFPDDQRILASWIGQSHPDHEVIFVLESEDDPIAPLVDSLCERHPRARKIISGLTQSCAQKNHNLVAALANVRPETRIIVFCDSTNQPDHEWLDRFIRPVEHGIVETVTTFRTFQPLPQNIAGVCQAIYSSFVMSLGMVKPTPWGGGTAIRRETFQRLGVVNAWKRTIVDDLVLGNLLNRSRVRVLADPRHHVECPLRNQTFQGFLSYLERQILFPKFTNPGIWLVMLLGHLNLTLAFVVTVIMGLVLWPLGLVHEANGILCLLFNAGLILAVGTLKAINPSNLSIMRWILYFPVCILLTAYAFLRSLILDRIVWQGKIYYAGKEGQVSKIDYTA